MLLSLPHELVHNISFHLIAHTPLGPPSALIPLLLACRSLHDSLSSPAFLSRICRFKLDTGAVTRRLFTPYHPDLAEHLVHVCVLLRALGRGDVFDVDADDFLGTALLLMLDNDGKNYAQLKHAGIHAYVENFVKLRLWEGSRDRNYGWPLDTKTNATALWLMWLLTQREALLAESTSEREQLVLRLLPFVVCPHLYPSSEAPPNHFDLPLDPSNNPSHQPPISLPLPNTFNDPSKTYPHYIPPRSVSTVYFRARPALSWPLASVAAKLLFVARRELRPITIPGHIPPGPGLPGQGGGLTQADYHELNAAKAAELPRGAIWDWEKGVAVAVNAPYVPPPFVPTGPLGVAAGIPPVPGPAAAAAPLATPAAPPSPQDPIIILPGDEESRKWDTTFWRMRLCGDFRAPRPKFLPGETFKLGSMCGAWQGRIYIPQGAQYTQLLHQPIYPGVPDERAAEAGYGLLTENSLGLVMQPIFLDVKEHHRVCGCAERDLEVEREDQSASDEEEEEANEQERNLPERNVEDGSDKRGCGIIPVPQPRAWLHRVVNHHEENQNQPHPHPHPPPAGGAAPVPVAAGPDVAAAAAMTHHIQAAQALAQGQPQPPAPAPAHAAQPAPAQQPAPAAQPQPQPPHHPQAQAQAQLDPTTHPSALQPHEFPDRIDMSMCNAWMPGLPGGVGWVTRESALGFSFNGRAKGGNQGQGQGKAKARAKARDEMVFSTDFKVADVYAPGGCVSVGGGRTSLGLSLGSNVNMESNVVGDVERKNGFVYETWNPERPSSHDVLQALSEPSPPPSPSFSPSLTTSSPSLPLTSPATSHPPSQKAPAHSPLNTLNFAFKPSATCAQCAKRSKALREQRRREEEEAKRMLDGVLRTFEMGKEKPKPSAPSQDVRNADARMDVEEEDDQDVEMQDLDMTGFGEEVGRVVGDALASSFEQHDHDHDHPEEEEYYEELSDVDDDDDDVHDAYGYGVDANGRIEVLGDDLPNGEPGFYTVRREVEVTPSAAVPSTSAVNANPSAAAPQAQLQSQPPAGSRKRTYIPATRREYDRSRIGVPCTGVKDIVVTGETGRRHRMWQDYSCYGRVRMWDGLVGILRYSRRSETNSIFIFGYVVGDNNFVGEWRVASSDPLRPVWGSAFVMSKRRDGVPTEEQ